MRSEAQPHDHAARTEIRTHLDATQFVEAGAGTGKTTALVARILELVGSGEATIDHLAAITFTEAAAAELRDRVYEALERASTEGHGATGPSEPSPLTGSPGRRALALDALDEIDSAAICTLHGFAHRILATHPFEAGLPPVFDVLDEGRSAVEFDERWEAFVNQILDDPALEGVLRRLMVCEVKLDHLRSVAEVCNDNWDLLIHVEPRSQPLGVIDPSPILDSLAAAAAEAESCTSTDDKLLVHIEGIAEFRAALHASTSELEILELLVNPPTLTSRWGQKDNWPRPVTEVRGLLTDANHARQALVARVISDGLSNLIPVITAFTLKNAYDRKREGRLEYHDLLVWALELVRNDAGVRVALHHEYQRLLIDEFQDTDPIQAEMAFRIANGAVEPGPGDVPWSELPFDPGRLFFVGDPKQAIYRFRRADIGLFLEVRKHRAADLIALTGNFRSVPGIIDWVNAVLGGLFADGIEGAQPAYEALHAERVGVDDKVEASPPVILLGGAMDIPTVADVRAEEAREIAATIRRICDEKWPVGDEKVPARLSDITILIRARTGLPILQEVLEAEGVPYRLESSSLVYEAPEVSDLLTILRAIDDPTDQISMVSALRSAPFGCGDDDLLEFHQAGGRWDYRLRAPSSLDGTGPVVTGMAALSDLHQQRWWRDVSGLVERVIEQRHLLELALDQRRPRDVWRRLRFVADQARQFTDAHGGDLRQYLSWVELQRRKDVRAVEVVLPESDDDAVRVMTIHGAKGLEFPIVFLTGLSSGASSHNGVKMLWGDRGPELKIKGGMATDGYDDLEVNEKVMETAEGLRLLYVGATRARDYLIVTLHHKVGTSCHAAQLLPLCEAYPELSRRFESDPTGAAEAGAGRDGLDSRTDGQLAPRKDTVADSAAQRSAWNADHQRLVTTGSLPRTLAATTIAGLVKEEDQAIPDHGRQPTRPGSSRDTTKDDPDIDLPPWRRGRAGTSIGRAVHAVLQSVDLETGSDVDRLAEAQAVAEGVHTRGGEIAGLVRAALDSDIVRDAVTGGRYWREMYVGVPATAEPGGPVIEGFIDLLIESSEGFTVVDYKTDAVHDDEQITQAMDSYRPQGATYALAVERALGRPVTRCVFLFLRGSTTTQLDVPDLREAMEDVEELVSALAGSEPRSSV